MNLNLFAIFFELGHFSVFASLKKLKYFIRKFKKKLKNNIKNEFLISSFFISVIKVDFLSPPNRYYSKAANQFYLHGLHPQSPAWVLPYLFLDLPHLLWQLFDVLPSAEINKQLEELVSRVGTWEVFRPRTINVYLIK